ncbi:aminotransferase class IV [Sulfurospirillum diekertiae]|uniref:Aminotransferase class IV n=1 Tax=Sulfurospirillum diekertiae TaxID=1854492 RepID=A0A6G9VQM5_9BACT|nr:aminotransferase class IV [Sulfurospirillum diekertiae]QIR75171.1 aminotransferase class IV [Sulfurospirillum diekertiae]QIR77837.1 aminotransferase class IV [Sulfurospirillum diekertiae]
MSCVIKSTSPCFETLKAVDGEIFHLAFHQARFDQTRQALYGSMSKIVLSEHLAPPKEGIYRVRVEYAEALQKIEYIPCALHTLQTFAFVETEIDYAYKYCNREALNVHLQGNSDDVIFTCKGKLQDTSIANIALLIDGEWKTPLHPLLKGTTRERLLKSGALKAEVLDMKSLQKAQKFAIMNALIGFKIIDNVLWIKE